MHQGGEEKSGEEEKFGEAVGSPWEEEGLTADDSGAACSRRDPDGGGPHFGLPAATLEQLPQLDREGLEGVRAAADGEDCELVAKFFDALFPPDVVTFVADKVTRFCCNFSFRL